jgi:LPXTG-site transpeptidase (sortase) family protein
MLSKIRFLFLTIVMLASSVLGPVTTANAASLPAEINKQFTPLQINSGGVSILRVTIFNPNVFQLTSASWTDNLVGVQPGLSIANPANVVNTCGGSVAATPGSTTLSLSGGTVPAQAGANPGQCYVEVNVTSTTPGNLINTIPANNLNSNGIDEGVPVVITNTSPASATLTVIGVTPPSLSKGFSPNTMWVGDVSQLTVTITNNDQTTTLTQTSFTDNLPANVFLASPVSATLTNCGGSASVTGAPGASSFTLNNGTVVPGQSCIVRVNVTSGVSGTYTNTIPAGPGGPGSITTQQGVTNASPASAQLNVQPVGVIKAFSPTSIPAGGTSTLTITLQNPTGSPYTGVGITDNLPAGLTVTGTPTTTCGGSLTNTANSVTLSGGTIPASATPPTPVGTCTITITVTAPPNAPASTQTNTIPPNSLVTTQGVTNPTAATAALGVQAALNVTKAYSPTTIAVGGTSTVTITLQNRTGSPLTGVNFTDNLPANLTVVGTPASPQCGGTITSTATSVTLTGGTIPAAPVPPTTPGTCTVTFQVTSSVPAGGTTYQNIIPAGDVVATGQGISNAAQATSNNLTVVAGGGPVGLSKAFQTNPIQPGQTSRLRITITAPVDTGLTGISIVDNLPPGLVIAATPAPVHGCTPGGTLTAPAGGSTITFTGGSRLAGASCNIDVWVTSTSPDTYLNSIPENAITTDQGRTNTNAATSTLRVTSLTMSKAFYPPSVAANGHSTLTITLQNTTSSSLVNVSLTDDLATMGGTVPTSGGYIASPANASTTCGGTLTAVPGTRLITLTGGVIPAQVGGVPGICTINVDVQGRGAPTTRTNTIPIANVNATVQSTGAAIQPAAIATAQLTIANLTIGVVKGFDPVLVYGGASSTMTVQLINPNNAVLTGIAFTDNMDLIEAGIVLANPVNFNTGTCGGTLTGSPGASSFSFSGGTLPANTSCFLTLSVVMEVNGNRTNRIPAGAVTTFNGVSSPDPTEASLTNLPGVSINKVFNPDSILVGEFATLTITIRNTSNIPVVNMGLNDNLPGNLPDGLEVADPPNAANTCGGTLTANPGDQIISLVGGGLPGNGTCNISVRVTSTVPGVYVNTIPAGAITADDNVTNNNPTSDTLTVNSSLFSLGNRVWYDTNNNSLLDGTEVGINGVLVQLYAADGSGNPTGGVLASQTTANGGYYRFDNLPAGDYVVVIPSTQFASGGPLAGYWSSGTTVTGAGVVTETPAPDPDNDVDNDDNGTRQTSGPFVGAVLSGAVTLGPSANEPTNDTDADPTNPPGEAPNNQSNRTVDFGFYRQELGNQIFVDVNGNGTFDAGDVPLAGAVVQLFAADGVTEINVGADGIYGTADDGPGGVTTGVDGTYLFRGLPQGSYIVRVTPPAGYTSTVDTFVPADTANPNVNINNNDNGVGTGSGTVSSNVVTLTPGSIGAAFNNVVTPATGTTYDPTVDFGFIAPLFSLGNRVWYDTNNNSLLDGTEVGINGVLVQLYAADGSGNPTGGVLASQTTANGGYYRFDNLPAGDYVVVIPSTQFASGGPLAGYWSSGTTVTGAGVVTETPAPDPDNDVDNDDNGTRQTSGPFVGAVLSGAVTLGPSANEPTNDTDADPTNPPGEAPNNQSNRTVDFGFYRQELGNQIFVDVNGNGTFDAGDVPLAGAVVQLFAADGVTEINVGADGIYGTADDGPGGVTTGVDGTYLFRGLPQGSYIVRVTPPAGYASTVDTANNGDTTNPNFNIDNNDNGVGTGSGTVSSNVVTLTPGSTGSANNNVVNSTTGTTYNPTVDFGFVNHDGITKSIIATSESFTSGSNVTIGEIVTYEIAIDIVAGTSYDEVTVTDRMDKGLAYVDCLLVTLGASDLTGTVCPSAAVSSITNPGDSAANPANPGRQVVFTIGDIADPGTDTTLVIRYRAIVLDVIENQSGVSLGNNANWAWTGGSASARASNVDIVEPDLGIRKTATPSSSVPIGTPVEFTLFIDHTVPQSQADAFDVIVTDILPSNLQYVQCTVQYIGGLAPDTPASDFCNPGTTTTDLVFVWDVFPLGQTSTIRFNAILLGSPAVNEASVAWTSLPIDPGIDGLPIQLSVHNVTSTERWYDPLDDVNIYSSSDNVTINAPAEETTRATLPSSMPPTGFAPGVITRLPQQPSEKSYAATTISLEIPSLGVRTSIVGVPLVNGDWDVSWLWRQAGWLDGTAFPGWNGNSALTGHVYLPDGTPGPFVNLGSLKWGDTIIVRAYGSMYVYEVRENRTIRPNDMSVLKSEDIPWLTLITCKNYDEATNTYANRTTVRAVLIRVTQDTSADRTNKR